MTSDPFSPLPTAPRPADTLADALWRSAIALDPTQLAKVCEKSRQASPPERQSVREAAEAAARTLSASISSKSAPDLAQAALCLLSLARGGFSSQALAALPAHGPWAQAARACFLNEGAGDLSSLASTSLRAGDVPGLVFAIAGGARLLPDEAPLWALFALDNAPMDHGQSAYWVGAGYANAPPPDRAVAAESLQNAIGGMTPDPWLSEDAANAWRQSIGSCLAQFQKGMLEFGDIKSPQRASQHKSV